MHEFYEANPKDRIEHPETSKEIISQIVPEIETPCQNIFSELYDNIERGEYGMIWEEGKSARIPTYVIGRAIGDIYKEKGLEYPAIETSPIYFSLESPNLSPAIKKAADRLHARKSGKRVLLITEYMSKGITIARFKDLEKAGIEYDVAALFSANPKEAYASRLGMSTKLFVGEEEAPTPLIYQRPELLGRRSHDDKYSIHKFSKVNAHTTPFNPLLSDITVKEIMQEVWPQAQTLRRELVRSHHEYRERDSNSHTLTGKGS